MPSPKERIQLIGDHSAALLRGEDTRVRSSVLLEIIKERLFSIKNPYNFLFSELGGEESNGLIVQELDDKHSIAINGKVHQEGFLVVSHRHEPKNKKGFMQFTIYGKVRPFADRQNFYASGLRQKDFFEQLEEDIKIQILNWTSMAITRKIEAERESS